MAFMTARLLLNSADWALNKAEARVSRAVKVALVDRRASS